MAVSGLQGTDFDPDPEGGGWYGFYSPRFFFPPLKIISLPDQCPSDVAEEINSANQLFYCDLPAAINHLRKSAEVILDYLKIPRQQMVKDKKTGKRRRKFRDLHNRISEFRKKNPQLADRLEAVKWIGNRGSHSNEIEKDDFFDALDLIEDFILEHFVKRGRTIVAMSKAIIRQRGPRPR